MVQTITTSTGLICQKYHRGMVRVAAMPRNETRVSLRSVAGIKDLYATVHARAGATNVCVLNFFVAL